MKAMTLLLAAALLTGTAAPALAQSSASPSAAPAAPSGQSDTAPTTASPSAAAIVPATSADLKPNVGVYDVTGGQVGTIESVTSAGAVISTGTARAEIPVASFNKNAQGLVIGMTKTQLEAAVAKATPPKS